MAFEQPAGATPIDSDEAEALIPTHIATQGQLNEWEQANIFEAEHWAFSRRRTDVLTIDFLLELHRRMFANTWRWAGTIRRTDKNMGVPVPRIRLDLRNLLDDAQYWIEHGTYQPDEIAVRLHHRLTQIHAFPNGNGRHARLMADVLLVNLDRQRFSWGAADLYRRGQARQRYLAALREADHTKVGPLLAFARS